MPALRSAPVPSFELSGGTEESLEKTYRRYRHSRRKQRSWAADNPGNVEIRRELLSRLREQAGDRLPIGRVLDIGCGGGWLLRALEQIGVAHGNLHGVDLIESRVGAARKSLPGADIRRADARRLPYDDGSFDLVTLLTVLSSMPDAGTARASLEAARRVLAPGGALIVYEARRRNPANRATRLVTPTDFDRALGPDWREVPLTVVPALARRLGSFAPRLYPPMSRFRPLLTHRLMVYVAQE